MWPARLTSREAEKAMDQFAGAFLVPYEELERLAGAHRNDVSLGELRGAEATFQGQSCSVSSSDWASRESCRTWKPGGTGRC